MAAKSSRNKSLVNVISTRLFRYICQPGTLVAYIVLGCAAFSSLVSAVENNMVRIEAGFYTPLFKNEDGPEKIEVEAFYLDKYPVTNRQFYTFSKKNKKWGKGNIKPIFSDSNYLKQITDASIEGIAEKPVTNVSWFSARAYCRSLDKRLPTSSEWEYVGMASRDAADATKHAGHKQQILDWYSRPATDVLPDVKDTPVNYWQVHGMHGVVWELVSDFNTALVTGESRGDSQLEKQLFCGGGAASSVDPGDYAAFMRYAMRSSYSAHYTIESLGFRCARDINSDKEELE